MTAMPAFFERAFGEEPPVRLIDEDPDMFASLPPRGQLDARARAIAPVVRLERGPWSATVTDICDHDSCLGLLVLDGLLVHSVVVVHEPRSEIVGPGDVLQPWQRLTEVASVPFAGLSSDPLFICVSNLEQVEPLRILQPVVEPLPEVGVCVISDAQHEFEGGAGVRGSDDLDCA